MAFSKNDILIDPVAVTDSIVKQMRDVVAKQFHKRGAVLGVSGGIDSSVCLALSVKAFGPERVVGLAMPEEDSNPESEMLANDLSKQFGTELILEDMTAAVAGFGTYTRRDEMIKNVFPEFTPEYKAKIVLPDDLMEKETLNIFQLTIIAPDGIQQTKRIPLKEYLQIVAASNFKQRSRMAMEYYHADRLNYVVIGTGNKNEHDQGFFVKWGDGGADIKPIAHLYKTQVYQLAKYLDIPEDIQNRIPTTDTYSAECTQEEFFYRVPFDIADTVWLGMERNVPVAEIAKALDLDKDQVIRVQNDIVRKVRTTEYLKANPVHLV